MLLPGPTSLLMQVPMSGLDKFDRPETSVTERTCVSGPDKLVLGAGDGTRTRDVQLGKLPFICQ